MQNFSEEEVFRIHRALHSSAQQVELGGATFPIVVSKNGCRTLDLRGWKFMEQNIKKASKYTQRALRGEKLTWIIAPGKWGLIADDKIETYNAAIRRGNGIDAHYHDEGERLASALL